MSNECDEFPGDVKSMSKIIMSTDAREQFITEGSIIFKVTFSKEKLLEQLSLHNNSRNCCNTTIDVCVL